jgi:hypothetical protein
MANVKDSSLGPVSQSYLMTEICLKAKLCHKIVLRFIITVSQNFHILFNKSDLKISLMTNLKIASCLLYML